MEIKCPECGEGERLMGSRRRNVIDLRCERCGAEWMRSLEKRCERCGSTDVQQVPLAIVEKGRGTQLSVVGTRAIMLCSRCDATTLRRYHRNRPNPLMPDELPTVAPQSSAIEED